MARCIYIVQVVYFLGISGLHSGLFRPENGEKQSFTNHSVVGTNPASYRRACGAQIGTDGKQKDR